MAKYTYEVVKPNQIVFEDGQPVRLEVGTTYVTDKKIKGDRVKLTSELKASEPKLEVATPSKDEPVKDKPQTKAAK